MTTTHDVDTARFRHMRAAAGVASVLLFVAAVASAFVVFSRANRHLVVAVTPTTKVSDPDPSRALQLLNPRHFSTSLTEVGWIYLSVLVLVIVAIVLLGLVAQPKAADPALKAGLIAVGLLMVITAYVLPTMVGLSEHEDAANKVNAVRLVDWSHQRYGMPLTRDEAESLVTPASTIYVETGAPITSAQSAGAQTLILNGSNGQELPVLR